LFKQQLDFSFETGNETMDRLPKIQREKIVGTTVGFSIEKHDLKTMDRLVKMHGQKIVETTVRFSI